MTADGFFKRILFIARKNQTGSPTPTEFNYAGSMAQWSFYDWCIGQLEQQRYDKPVPRIAIGMNDKVSNFLLPVKITNELVTGSSGNFTKPATFDYLSLMTDTSFKTITVLDDTKFPARYGSKIDPITDSTTSAFGRKTTTGWLIYPTTITQIYVSYYFRPPAPVWAYTENASGRKVYNQAGSTDPVFDDIAMTKIIGTTCKIMGISFKEEFLVEYGKEVETAGR